MILNRLRLMPRYSPIWIRNRPVSWRQEQRSRKAEEMKMGDKQN